MIAAYPDLNGCVGEADPPAITPREEADVAGRAAYEAADALAILLDRDDGGYGEKPEILDSIIARLSAMSDEVRAALGEVKP